MGFLWKHPFEARVVLVRTTLAARPPAEALARRLIEKRLAACVHISEVASTYRWQGRVQQETEFVVEARTTRSKEVAAAMLEGHPYDEPMVEAYPSWVNAGYGKWMRGEVG